MYVLAGYVTSSISWYSTKKNFFVSSIDFLLKLNKLLKHPIILRTTCIVIKKPSFVTLTNVKNQSWNLSKQVEYVKSG